MQSSQASPAGLPEEQEPNLPFIGLPIFISQLREKKCCSSLEQHLFSTCPARIPWLAAVSPPARGSSMPQSRRKNRALLLSAWWNLVPRFLGISLLLPFFSVNSLKDPGPGYLDGGHTPVSQLPNPQLTQQLMFSLPLQSLSQEGKFCPRAGEAAKRTNFLRGIPVL